MEEFGIKENWKNYLLMVVLFMAGMMIESMFPVFPPTYQANCEEPEECPDIINIPNATIYISAKSGIKATWNWSDSFINSTQLINASISTMLWKSDFIYDFLGVFDNASWWFHNETGQSTLENSPDFDNMNEPMPSGLTTGFIIVYNNTIEEFEPLNITLYGDVLGEYVMMQGIHLEFYDENAEDYWEDGNINFGINPENLFDDIGFMLMNSGGMENDTVGDYFDYLIEYLTEAFEPFIINIEDGSTTTLEIGDFTVLQNEIEGANLYECNQTLEYTKNSVKYLLHNDGNHELI